MDEGSWNTAQLTIACGLVYVLGVLVGIFSLSGVVVGNRVLVPGNPGTTSSSAAPDLGH